MEICTQCKSKVERLAVFPGGLCLECWAISPEANRQITAQELAQMWGGK
jgi:hypothetical protein